MPGPSFVIMAAGEGTRMRSATPKVLHDLCGRPLVQWPIHAARLAGASKIVVVDGPQRPLDELLNDDPDVVTVVQAQPLGTGDAVRVGIEPLGDDDGPVVVLSGDVPLVTAGALAQLLAAHERSRAEATMLTMELADPTGYGRVVRDSDGNVVKVVETKVPGDAEPEHLAIKEVNSGIFAFDIAPLRTALLNLRTDNAQGELYLPQVLEHVQTARAQLIDDPSLTLGVNDRADLARVRAHAQARIHARHLAGGVTIVDPQTTLIDAGVTIAPDTRIEPSTYVRGTTRIGANCTVGPLTTLIDCEVGDDVRIVHSYAQQAVLHARVTVGPFAYLRPGAVLREEAKAGTFVEIKNSDIGPGSKVPHLSYIGDADVGARANLGAATITANYDGKHKHRTTIGDGVKTSVDTTLVAPVTLGDGSYTGAGSVITEDVPPEALAIARARQVNVEDYAKRRA